LLQSVTITGQDISLKADPLPFDLLYDIGENNFSFPQPGGGVSIMSVLAMAEQAIPRYDRSLL